MATADRVHGPSRRRGCRALIALLALLAGPALADAPAAPVAEPIPRVAGAIDRAPGSEAIGIARPATGPAPAKPTTRASVRARIAAIDPEQWLARFGETEHHTVARH